MTVTQNLIPVNKNRNFSKGKRSRAIQQTGKTRVTIYLDDAILKHFKSRSAGSGKGYQTLINEELQSCIAIDDQATLTAKLLRKIVREELEERLPQTITIRRV